MHYVCRHLPDACLSLPDFTAPGTPPAPAVEFGSHHLGALRCELLLVLRAGGVHWSCRLHCTARESSSEEFYFSLSRAILGGPDLRSSAPVGAARAWNNLMDWLAPGGRACQAGLRSDANWAMATRAGWFSQPDGDWGADHLRSPHPHLHYLCRAISAPLPPAVAGTISSRPRFASLFWPLACRHERRNHASAHVAPPRWGKAADQPVPDRGRWRVGLDRSSARSVAKAHQLPPPDFLSGV